MKKDRNLHYFDKRVAKKFTVNAAIVLNNIDFWIKANKEQNKREVFKEGKWWTYSTISDYSKVMDYMSQKQIEKALNDLKKSGLLIKDCFNENSYDRTAWYTIDYDLFSEMFDKKVGMHFLSRGNGNPPQGKCSINKNIEEDIKENTRENFKISDSEKENQTTLEEKEKKITPQRSVPAPLKEKKAESTVKQTETTRKSTNGSKVKLSYTNEIKTVLECFNSVGNKNSELTDEHSKKIVALLDFVMKKGKVEKETAAQNICDYLTERAKEHKVIEDGSKERFIDKKHFTIDSLLTKPKYTRYLSLKKEMAEEKTQKQTKKAKTHDSGFF